MSAFNCTRFLPFNICNIQAKLLAQRLRCLNIYQCNQLHQDHVLNNKLYADHIPTTSLQKCLLFAGSSIMGLADPYRDDLVAISGETGGICAIKKLRDTMLSSEEGRAILKDRPRISTKLIDMEQLRKLPQNSLGHQYVTFMETHKITSDTRKPVKYVDDEELAYVMQRYRETHDFTHLLCHMYPNLLGEVVIKWIEALQTNIPMCYGAAILGPLKLDSKQREIYRSKFLPYALRTGYNAKPFINYYYEKRWEQDIDELRKELNIPPFD